MTLNVDFATVRAEYVTTMRMRVRSVGLLQVSERGW